MSFEVYRESRELFSQAEKCRFVEYFASSISHESSGFESATRFECVRLPIFGFDVCVGASALVMVEHNEQKNYDYDG